MDNVEFVKAYEQWKNSLDSSPERFQRELELTQRDEQVEFLLAQIPNETNFEGVFIQDLFSGIYDNDIRAANEEAEND